MRVHLPKPLHGWRAFIGEVGIIVLGVLIALGFGQLVQEWQWRRDVGTTRQALANELAASAEQGAERLAVEDCLRDRVGELAARLRSSNGRWSGDPLPMGQAAAQLPHWDNRTMQRVYSSPLRGWSQDAWDTAKSTGVLDHMGHDDVAYYSAVYEEISAIRDFQNQEIPLESRLSYLSADQQLDNGSRLGALGTLGQLDALNATMAGLSSLLIQQIKALHIQVDRAAASRELKEMIDGQRQYRGRCVKDVSVQF